MKKDHEKPFIDLNQLRLEGTIREVDPPSHESKRRVEGRNKLVIIFSHEILT